MHIRILYYHEEGEHRSWCQTSWNMPNQKLLLSGKKCDVTEGR